MAQPAKFLSGDLGRHILVMTGSASVGLIMVFIVDLIDLYFISLLGEAAMAAAVGFAANILFFATSIAIGLSIAVGALVSRRLGAEDAEGAQAIATDALILGGAVGVALGAILFIWAPEFMTALGARGETHDYGVSYLRITGPATVFMALAMALSSVLRGHGDARRAMNVTISSAVTNAALDPLFIFGLGMGLEGAALATVAARIVMFVAALRPVITEYGGFAAFDFARLQRNLTPIAAIAGPAILTNVATPVGFSFVTRALAEFGTAAVAAYAVIGRVQPVAFAMIFALSGAVGPIIGQNYGAGRLDRVRETIVKALIFSCVVVAVMWAVLFAARGFLADAFSLTGEARDLMYLFCTVVAPFFVFNGALFVGNAAFNNLDHPFWSTALNWGRNTLGVAPFVWLGASWGGAAGVMVGQAAGGALFGLAAAVMALRLAAGLSKGGDGTSGDAEPPVERPRPSWPFSSPRG